MRRYAILGFPIALLIAIQVVVAVHAADALLRQGALAGPDGYMWLVRVEALYESGDWYDSFAERSNVPWGDDQHWTRPFDVLLLAGAVLLEAMIGFEAGLFWWGALISPLLHVAVLIALMWAARPLFDERGLFYLGILAIVLPAVLTYFTAGRPDHHSLIGFLFVVILGYLTRLLSTRFDTVLAVGAGLVSAAILWVSVEGMLTVAVVVAALGLAWILWRETFADKNLIFATALIGGLVLALLAERPWPDIGVVAYDRLSIVHLPVFGTLAVFWLAVSLIDRHTSFCDGYRARGVIAVVGAITAVSLIWIAFPAVLAGPFADVDPGVATTIFKNTSEVQPLVNPANAMGSLVRVALFVGPAFVAVPVLAATLWRRKNPEWRAWTGIAIALVVFLPLALYQVRWSTYVELLAVIPYTALLLRLLGRLGERPVLRAMTTFGFAVGFVVLAMVLAIASPKSGGVRQAGRCPLGAMSDHLADATVFGSHPRRIMSFAFFGTELLYRTPHAVVGTSFHHAAEGLRDTYDFFRATDDRVARRILAVRGIDLVMICPAAAEAALYRAAPGDGATLLDRIEAGAPPVWLVPVMLPSALASDFLLFTPAR